MTKKLLRNVVILAGIILTGATIISCQKINDFNTASQTNALEKSTQQLSATVVLGGNLHPGHLLASNCFQCHGTNGNGLEHLAGKSANEIVEELNEMKLKSVGNNIMNVHARGYTADQIKLIGDFFSKQ